jgi:ferritin
MRIQAQEELTHVHRIYTYIIHRSARPRFDAAKAPDQEWASPLAAMQDAYKHECFISEKIGECLSLALKEGDHSTSSMLQWFVNEQVEEEASADDVVQKLKLIGDNTSALFLLDTELAGRTFAPDAAAE